MLTEQFFGTAFCSFKHCWAITGPWKNVLGVLEKSGNIFCKQGSANHDMALNSGDSISVHSLTVDAVGVSVLPYVKHSPVVFIMWKWSCTLYYCSELLDAICSNMILRQLAPQLHIPYCVTYQPEDIPIVPTMYGTM